ncbi:ATP-binding protein [Thalassobellus citreus]|uniref:ATP-binding protein n=1 Tax=Thalassobellus citreus TaxID=3367752 RepID=UPI0037A5C26A
MKKLRFQTRIYIGLGVLLFVTILLSAISFVELNDVNKRIKVIYDHPLLVSNSINEIRFNVVSTKYDIHTLVDSKNGSDASLKLLKQIRSSDSINNIHFNIVKDRYLGKKEDFNNVYYAYSDVLTSINEIIRLNNLGQKSEARLLLENEGYHKCIFLFEKLNVLSIYASNKAKNIYTQTVKDVKFNKSIFLAFTLILVFLGFMVAFFISKSITQPINVFLQQLRALYWKEKDIAKEDVLKTSEQELLSNVVEELKTTYSKLNKFNSELEEKVEYRTRELQQNKIALINTNKQLVIEKEKAENSEQLKSAFLANMSHEIRTPMNTILGFSNLLKEDNLEKKEKQQFIGLIQDSGKRLLSIISDVVDISKINSNQLKICIDTCNLNEVIDSLYYQFSLHPKAKRVSIKTKKDLSDNECFIKTDKNRLMQILSNLLENALKFTTEGTIKFGYCIEDDFIQFFVKDTGVGIDEKYREFVFDRFSQIVNGKSNEEGNGLGLSIAKGLVELLGGEIWIDSNTEKGSKFMFKLPFKRVNKYETNKSYINENIEVSKIDEKNILIVEDENSNFIYLREVLKKFNVKIFRAYNGLEAVELLTNNSNIDFVFMDVKMPVMDGYQATTEIRKFNFVIPIITLTAYALSEDDTKAMQAGCNEYIAKPVSKEIIEDLLFKYLKIKSKTVNHGC